MSETPTEKPEPNEENKKKAAEMMTAYQERPTLVLPGTGGAVSGTAVGEWLDDDGNSKYADDTDSPAAKASADGDETVSHGFEEQVAEDKEFNAAVRREARERGGAHAGDDDKAEASEDERAVSK